MVLYNTLTGKKEEFRPIDPKEVRMYTCGPTVYNYAHIGNLRAYVFADVLRRTLEFRGFKVRQVMNITDVGEPTSDECEDKMAKGLRREGKPQTLEAMSELGEFYAKAFLDDAASLNILPAAEYPRASRHIKEDLELIDILLNKGTAYKLGDGIYFDTSAFPAYGKLGNIDIAGLKAGARVKTKGGKKNPIDFALWKFSTGPIGWESPWGRGFPGWHIECSAMSRAYLGQPFDIHTGGIDHIPTHHQNEIAQSEAAYGVPLANYWMHNEHLVVASGKMAKSGENFVTLRTLRERGIHPLAYRYYLLGASYRTPMQFSFEAVEAAETSYFKLLIAFASLEGDAKPPAAYVARFSDAVSDDLGTPAALPLLWEALRSADLSPAEKRAVIVAYDRVLGLDIEHQARKLQEELEMIPDHIKKLASAREDARTAKDFKTADALRTDIRAAGFEVMDTDSGPIIRKSL